MPFLIEVRNVFMFFNQFILIVFLMRKEQQRSTLRLVMPQRQGGIGKATNVRA